MLNDIIDRQAGTLACFNYSNAMVEAGEGGLVWDEGSLSKYLAAPQAFVPGSRMNFGGLKKEDDIEDVIADLATFSE